MHQQDRIVIIGAGLFGLSTALELCHEGYRNIQVLDRHVPPVPDGSSVDISRVVRFDYGDPDYASISKEAYDLWNSSPLWEGLFFKAPYLLVAGSQTGRPWIDKCMTVLNNMKLPWQGLESPAKTRSMFPTLTGKLAEPDFSGYANQQAGWADAELSIIRLRDRCIKAGVSFISGAQGTVTELVKGEGGKIIAVRTKAGVDQHGDQFILAAGAWSSSLISMYNSNLATGQVIGYIRLNEEEMARLADLPIYMNFDSGWFCFPPHQRTRWLKFAIHGRGYTRTRSSHTLDRHQESSTQDSYSYSQKSIPPPEPRAQRTNFVPDDASDRLRAGLREILPEFATRPLDKAGVCWYSETPTGDFIMDYHPDYSNVFLATGGSGHAFKFLPVIGKYAVASIKRSLPSNLRQKWRFRTEYNESKNAFDGDGSRGGPSRREMTKQEKARL